MISKVSSSEIHEPVTTSVPALRFGEFEGEWEESRLRDVSKIRSGTTPSRSNKSYFMDGVIAWVKTTDLNNGGCK